MSRNLLFIFHDLLLTKYNNFRINLEVLDDCSCLLGGEYLTCLGTSFIRIY